MELLWDSRPSWTPLQRLVGVTAALGVAACVYAYTTSASTAPTPSPAPLAQAAPAATYATALEIAAALNANRPAPVSIAPEQARAAFSQPDPTIPTVRRAVAPPAPPSAPKHVAQSRRTPPPAVRPGGPRTGASTNAGTSLFSRMRSSVASDRIRARPVIQ